MFQTEIWIGQNRTNFSKVSRLELSGQNPSEFYSSRAELVAEDSQLVSKLSEKSAYYHCINVEARETIIYQKLTRR